MSTPENAKRRAPRWTQLENELPPPPDAAEEADIVWQHLRAEFGWYHAQATSTRLAYQIMKTISLVVAATVPVMAALGAPAGWTAGFAALVVVLEAIQQLFQLQTNWITYRGTAEALRQLAFRYAARVGPYKNVDTRRELLADELHALVNDEGSRWSSAMREARVGSPPATSP